MQSSSLRKGLVACWILAFFLAAAWGCSPTLQDASFLAGESIRQKMDIRAGGFRRSYLVHIPEGYDPSRPHPLVVVLHGAFSTARQIEAHSGFSDLADREDFLVLYPNGITLFGLLQHWNAGHCCGKAAADGVDDVGFLEAAIREVTEHMNVDLARIYMTGFSNGGMMTHRFGAEACGMLAAIAPMAGSLGGRAGPKKPWWQVPEPACPLPVAIMHGRDDEQVPYRGGGAYGKDTERHYLSVEDSAAFWVRANGCTLEAEETRLHQGTVHLKRWEGCAGGSEVRVYTWENWGHVWPGAPFTDGLAPDDPFRGFHAAETVWEFFKGHARSE